MGPGKVKLKQAEGFSVFRATSETLDSKILSLRRMPISPLRLPVPNSGASKHTNNIAAVGIKPQLSRAQEQIPW
jgi:hypothetical protein